MARYGDLDALEKKLFPFGMVDDGRYALPAKSVKAAIDNLPTAEVSPKSEVAREIFEAIDAALEKAIDWTNEDIAEAITKEDSIAIASKNGALLMIHTIKTCLKTMGREYVGGE